MKNIQLMIISFLFISGTAFSSPQGPDFLIYKGDTMAVFTLILEKYFEMIKKEDRGALFGLKFREAASPNCWRGYQAIYSIENDSLFLKNMTSCNEVYYGSIDEESSRERIREIFGDKMINDKVFLDWYSGDFTIQNGKLLRWDGVFHHIYEKEILFNVKDGKVCNISKIKNYVNKPGRINRKYKEKISDILFKELKKVNWDYDKMIDCDEEYLITIGKDGRVNKVSMVDYETEEEVNKYWDINEYNSCIEIIYNGLKKLKFDIIKKNGIPIEEEVYLEIGISDDNTIENRTD